MTYNQLSYFPCAMCGKPIPDSKTGRKQRTDKRYCSTNCRNAYSRWKLRILRLEREVQRGIDEIGKYLDHRDTESQAVVVLAGIVKHSKQTAYLRGIKIQEIK